MWQRTMLALAGCALAAAAPAVARADGPTNDWKSPAPLRLSHTTTGTIDQGKRGHDEPAPSCADTANAVWYRVVLGHRGSVVARLETQSGLNGALAVFRERRAQTREVACRKTDARGRA